MILLFDFTSMFASENATRIVERRVKKLLLCVAGDSLIEVIVGQIGIGGLGLGEPSSLSRRHGHAIVVYLILFLPKCNCYINQRLVQDKGDGICLTYST